MVPLRFYFIYCIYNLLQSRFFSQATSGRKSSPLTKGHLEHDQAHTGGEPSCYGWPGKEGGKEETVQEERTERGEEQAGTS